jgi:ATP-dependent RNA helicase DDX56/DBP9
MAEDTKFETFASFSYLISPLILRALADLGFSRPTLVQQKAIPLALENQDVLARARTGSGKTAAYCIPLVQKILNAKAVGTPRGSHPVHRFSSQILDFLKDPALEDDSRQSTRALILVPTRELAEQVLGHLRGLVKYCENDVSIVNVAGGVTAQLQRCVSTLVLTLTRGSSDTDNERV